MTRPTTPNFTRTDLRELADRAQSVADALPNHDDAAEHEREAKVYAQAVEDTIRTLIGDARPTPELTAATGGGLI